MNFHAAVAGDRALTLPLALGHFLPWYTIRGNDFPLTEGERATFDAVPVVEDYRHWNDARSGYRRTYHHVPEPGIYDSRDPKIIEWQIRAALDHGIEGFIVNWYGKNSVENVITLHWLRGLRRWNAEHRDRPFVYFISYDAQAQWPTEGKQPVSFAEDFRYIRDQLMTDAYLCRDGRPLFSVFPYGDQCREIRGALDGVFGPGGADLIWSGTPAGSGEDACYAWVRPDEETINLNSPYCWSDPDNVGEGFLRAWYREAHRGSASCRYLMHGAWPGFNNQFVSWAWSKDPTSPHIRPCVICRETSRGNTLDLTWRVYLDYLEAGGGIPAPLVQVVTWNDYAETTTVEPTRDYGTRPAAQCRAYIAEARRLWRSRAVV